MYVYQYSATIIHWSTKLIRIKNLGMYNYKDFSQLTTCPVSALPPTTTRTRPLGTRLSAPLWEEGDNEPSARNAVSWGTFNEFTTCPWRYSSTGLISIMTALWRDLLTPLAPPLPRRRLGVVTLLWLLPRDWGSSRARVIRSMAEIRGHDSDLSVSSGRGCRDCVCGGRCEFECECECVYRARVEGGSLGGCGVVLPYHCTGRGRLVHSNSIIYTLLNVYIWRERERERGRKKGREANRYNF